MKLLHIADTHIGFTAYNKLDENGINQREKDVFDSFNQFIKYALKCKPDVIIHAGDLFDSVRPTNRAISFVMDQLLLLSKAKIPFVVIAGNHSTPRLRETGSVFRLLEHIEYIYPIYKGKYESLEIKDLIIHAIPHCKDQEVFDTNLKKIKINKRFIYNILVLHSGVEGVNYAGRFSYTQDEFNELKVKSGNLKDNFDYIALGHFHKYTEIQSNAFFAGSTERLSFAEAGQGKGFIEIDLEHKKFEFKKLNIREMIELEPILCKGLKSGEVMSEIEKRIGNIEAKNKIIRLKIKEIPIHVYHALDFIKIKKLTQDSVHFEKKFEILREKQNIQFTGNFDSLQNEFESFLKNTSIEGLNKNKILKMGQEYISVAGES